MLFSPQNHFQCKSNYHQIVSFHWATQAAGLQNKQIALFHLFHLFENKKIKQIQKQLTNENREQMK